MNWRLSARFLNRRKIMWDGSRKRASLNAATDLANLNDAGHNPVGGMAFS